MQRIAPPVKSALRVDPVAKYAVFRARPRAICPQKNAESRERVGEGGTPRKLQPSA